MSSLTVAIPALNEAQNLPVTIGAVLAAAAKAPGLALEIVVVDDGSTDDTVAVVGALSGRDPRIRLVRNPRNLGLGASIRRAIDEARTERFIVIPGDNDIPLDTLELLFRNVAAADIVMTYFVNEEVRGRLRYLASEAFRLTYTTLFDLYLTYLNGPAIYPVARLRELELHSTRFSIVAEINVKLLRQGLSFLELPSRRQTGNEDSAPMSLGNVAEALRVLACLAAEVHVMQRGRYAKRPVRVVETQ